MKPNFIIIGAARSATTSLHKYLGEHPDIFLSEPKEINFFSNQRFYNKGQEWYESHFAKAKHKAVGEGSTSYTSAPNIDGVAERIFNSLGPRLKFLYIVRDPVKRLLSHHTHYISRGDNIPELSTVIEEKRHSIVHQGRYNFQLNKYLEFFDKSQFKVISVDQLKQAPQQTMKEIYSFLDVDSSFDISDPTTQHNNNNRVIKKNKRGQKVINWYHKNFEHLPQPYAFRNLINKVAEIGGTHYSTPNISEAHLNELKSFYRDDLLALRKNWEINLTCGGDAVK